MSDSALAAVPLAASESEIVASVSDSALAAVPTPATEPESANVSSPAPFHEDLALASA